MSTLNQLVKSFLDEDLETFKILLNENKNSLATKFTDPDNENKEITLLNLIISYQDKLFFNALKPYLNNDIINQGYPRSSLFNALRASKEDTFFFDEIISFNPDLTVKDERGNNILNYVSDSNLIPLDFIQKVLDLGVDPFSNREHARENPFSTAVEYDRLDIVKLFSKHPNFEKSCTEQHLGGLIRRGHGVEFQRLINEFDSLSDLLDDSLFNQACNARNVIAVDTILEKAFFIPGKEQLSILVNLMCDKYLTDEEKNASLNIAQYLFTIKIPFDKFTDLNGKNAWALSIENNNNEIFELLLKSPSTLNFVDGDGLSPLMYAVQEENLDYVKAIIEKRPYLMHKDIAGNTALLKAVFRKSEDIVNFLSKQPNIGVNEPNNLNQTPLNTAIKMQNISMVNSLIWSGADISLHPYKTIENNSVFGFDSNNIFTVLHDEQDYKTLDNFKSLIIKGFNPNQKNNKGDSLLNHFIKEGYLKNFQSLIRCNVNVQDLDAEGNNPLFNAFEKDADDYAVNLLVFHKNNIDFSVLNKNNENIYDIAAYCNSPLKVKTLVLSDPDINKENLNKVLPLLAMDVSFYDLEKLQPIIDFSFIDQNDNDLLMLSALNGNLENFEYFQMVGNVKPDLKLRNSLGKNLFDIILDFNETQKGEFLMKLPSSYQDKFFQYQKKKTLERDKGDHITSDGAFVFQKGSSPKKI